MSGLLFGPRHIAQALNIPSFAIFPAAVDQADRADISRSLRHGPGHPSGIPVRDSEEHVYIGLGDHQFVGIMLHREERLVQDHLCCERMVRVAAQPDQDHRPYGVGQVRVGEIDGRQIDLALAG